MRSAQTVLQPLTLSLSPAFRQAGARAKENIKFSHTGAEKGVGQKKLFSLPFSLNPINGSLLAHDQNCLGPFSSNLNMKKGVPSTIKLQGEKHKPVCFGEWAFV